MSARGAEGTATPRTRSMPCWWRMPAPAGRSCGSRVAIPSSSGAAERDHALRHGIDVFVVPGVTAALGCAATTGIPLTHRDHASAVTFVSGHQAQGEAAVDWRALASSRQTIVVYMGLANASHIR